MIDAQERFANLDSVFRKFKTISATQASANEYFELGNLY